VVNLESCRVGDVGEWGSGDLGIGVFGELGNWGIGELNFTTIKIRWRLFFYLFFLFQLLAKYKNKPV